MDRPLPAWFDDAKFGIFVHWTAAAVPAFAPVGPSPFDLAAEHVVAELAPAVRSRGRRFGTCYSGGLVWTFGGLPMTNLAGMIAAIPQTPEYLAYANAHSDDLIERYEPCVLWNDIGYPAAADLPALFEHYYERVPDGVVNNRFDFIQQTSGTIYTDFITPECSDAQGICAVSSVTPGSYWAQEIPPAPDGYNLDPDIVPVTVGFRHAVDLTSSPFVDPAKTGFDDSNGDAIFGVDIVLPTVITRQPSCPAPASTSTVGSGSAC